MISTLLTTLLIINAIVLIFLIVILQQGNEGGIGGALGGGNSQGFFGASGGAKAIIRATWICGFLFFAFAISSAWVRTHDRYALKNSLEKTLSQPVKPITPALPILPTPSPTEKPTVPAEPTK